MGQDITEIDDAAQVRMRSASVGQCWLMVEEGFADDLELPL